MRKNCLKFLQLNIFAFLLMFSNSIMADASDSCNTVFSDGLGASTNNGTIEIGYNSEIFSNPDTTLNANNIIYNPYAPNKTCETAFCSDTGSPFAPITLPSFQYQSGGSNYTVGYTQSLSFDGSITDIDTINMDSKTQLDFASAVGGVYRIKSLTFGYQSTNNFAPGDYYFENLDFTSNTIINVVGDGTVRFFVENYQNSYVTSYVEINSAGGVEGDPSKFVLSFYNDVFFNSGTIFTGYIYVDGKFSSESHNDFYGSIAAGEIWLSSTVDIYYRDVATYAPEFNSLCDLTTPSMVAHFTFDELVTSEYPDESANAYTATPGATSTINSSGQVCSAIETPSDTSNSLVGIETDIDSSEITSKGSFAIWLNLNSDWDDYSDRRTLLYSKKAPRVFGIEIDKRGGLQLEFKDSSNKTFTAETAATNFVAGDWHHVVVTWDFTSTIDVSFFIDGVQVTTLVAAASEPWANFTSLSIYNELYFFDRRARDPHPKYALNGLADELYLYNYEISNAQITNLYNDTRTPCPAAASATVDHFDFSFSNTGSTCPGFPSAITIQAMDASNTIITDYVGNVSLSTSSNHGSWTKNAADGTLTDATSDDGAATYQFVVSDLGEIVLDLENIHADNQIMTVEDSAESVSTNSSAISFSDNVFLVEPQSIQVAGRDLDVSVTLIQTDASNNQCGVATNYNQAKIKSWYEPSALLTNADEPRLNNVKLKDSEPNSSNETFNFINGIANITLTTSDIGDFDLQVLDEVSGFVKDTDGSDLTITGSANIILKPFALAMDFDNDADSANSIAVDANGSIFKTVDENFTLTVTPVLWESADDVNDDGEPDANADLSDNDAIPNFDLSNESIEISVTNVLPAGGVTGTLSGTTSSSDYSSNSYDYILNYSEVGIIELSASITNNGFLNNGDDSQNLLSDVGRFIPDHFSVSANSVNLEDAITACSLTYQGQSVTLDNDIEFTLIALDSDDDPVLNYSGDFNKFDASSLIPTLNRTTATLAYGADPTVIWQAPALTDNTNYDGDWLITLTPSSITYDKSNSTPTTSDLPYSAELNANVSLAQLADDDGVCVDSGSGCESYTSADITGATVVYGAAFLSNQYTSELQNAIIPVQLKIWATSNSLNDFYTITGDSCSTFLLTDFEFLSCTENSGTWCNADYQTNFAAPHSWSGLTSGEGALTIQSPGNNNTGQVQIRLNIPSYLQFDYYGSGLSSPSAVINFGINNNDDSLIFMQDVFR